MLRLALIVAATGLIALPARAEVLSCQLLRTCNTAGGTCTDDAEPTVMRLTIADDGNSATLEAGEEVMSMTLVDEGPDTRTFLAIRAGEGVGVLSVGSDGTLVAASNEFDGTSLMGVSIAGTCAPGNG